VQRKLALLEPLTALARDAGLTLAAMAQAFVLAHPAVTCALAGPRIPEQLDAALATADVRLDADLIDRIDELVAPGTDVDPTDLVVVDGALEVTNRRQPRSVGIDHH
jgi:aryl-alcohol dehydrogenase (NADP+)